MKHTLAVLALILGTTTVAAVEPTGIRVKAAAHSDTRSRAVAAAIDRSLKWLEANPASIADDELMEVVEEIMFYYALDAIAGNDIRHEEYRREIASRHDAIVSFLNDNREKRLHLQGDWASLTYPPLAYIVASMGLGTDSYRAIIDDLISQRHHLDLSRNAMQLWIAVYLERLGYTAVLSTSTLLNNSALQQDPETHILLDYFRDETASSENPQATVQFIYNITHEIIALTDFGAIQAPPVMAAQRDHYASLLDAAITWATRETAIDVLAELLFCVHLLDLGELAAMPAAIDLIIESQQDDGAFGITNPDRPNGKRHGVLTCLLALTTLGSSAQSELRPVL
ncbi:MAG: hypothetical protein PVF08_08575 [Gammaproteobacteria bacterium]|jgi:hypothetical protein